MIPLSCWDAGYNVLTEYVDDTGQWNTPDFTRFFVPKGHTAFAEGVPDANGNPVYGTYNYLAHDHLGTGRFAYDETKAQIGIVEHDPYGERTNQTGYVPYHEYTGKPFDEETGMYYFPFQYYHPHLARWTTPDPAGLVDGPNVYGYVKQNPILFLDRYGLQTGFNCWKINTYYVPEGEQHKSYTVGATPSLFLWWSSDSGLETIVLGAVVYVWENYYITGTRIDKYLCVVYNCGVREQFTFATFNDYKKLTWRLYARKWMNSYLNRFVINPYYNLCDDCGPYVFEW